MKQTTHLEIILVFSLAGVFLHIAIAAVPCPPSAFKCLNGKCIHRGKFCDNTDDCGDSSDEKYCDNGPQTHGGFVRCPSNWVNCQNTKKCIPEYFVCDGITDCEDKYEEFNCGKNLLKVPGVFAAKKELRAWLLNRRKSNATTDKWGSQVHRIAVALYLADESTFDPGNSTGNEIRYELTIQLLRHLKRDKKMNSQELALYIHALLVACMDPKDFYEENLVLKLRRRVEETKTYTNPFQILVLCNAGDNMTSKDSARVIEASESHLRPSWADVQALATMALNCIYAREGQNRRPWDLLLKLTEQQRTGSVGDFRTTALVTQAMLMDSYFARYSESGFNLNETVQVLIDGLQKKSIIHAYYALPVLSAKNLFNINTKHCSKEPITETDALQKTLDVNDETIVVQYSIWIGNKKNLAQNWELRIPLNSTVSDAIETIAKIDNRQNVAYSLGSGKPYVTAVNEIEDDPETEMYWSVYLRTANSDEEPKIVKESPMDVQLLPNQEIILWYKPASWNN